MAKTAGTERSGGGLRKALKALRPHAGEIAGTVLVNFLLPYLIYLALAGRIGTADALLASALPPIAWNAVEFIRRRRLDATSILVLAAIALSSLVVLGGGSVKLLQLRGKLVTGLIGLVFLGSAAIGRPLVYELARAGMARRSPEEAARLARISKDRDFRHGMTVMTLVWGFCLVTEAAIGLALVFVLSVRVFFVVGHGLGYGMIGLLGLWTYWYGRRMRRRGEAARAVAPDPPSS